MSLLSVYISYKGIKDVAAQGARRSHQQPFQNSPLSASAQCVGVCASALKWFGREEFSGVCCLQQKKKERKGRKEEKEWGGGGEMRRKRKTNKRGWKGKKGQILFIWLVARGATPPRIAHA
jgi:hypothetical protein